MKIKIFVFNPFQENTYLVSNEANECLIIDPGCLEKSEKDTLTQYIQENKLTLKYVLCTHLHLDHVFGCHFLTQQYGVEIQASQKDEFLMQHIKDFAVSFGLNPDLVEMERIGGYLKEGDCVKMGEVELSVLENPGHSMGGLLFYEKNEGIVFAGDSIFRGSIGRTDLYGGNYQQLIDNLHRNIAPLPQETVIYPGHGPSTTVELEKRYSAFLR